MSNETRARCSDQLEPTPQPGQRPVLQHIPGMLYYGYVALFVNMSIFGYLCYQGENNCVGVMGNSLNSSGYGCSLPAMVRAWRQVWSAAADTTSPLAPFGIAKLAAGGSKGHSEHMAGMRWSQTGNYA